MRNKFSKYWHYVLIALLLIVGGPILINESYKLNPIIYITKWDAEAMLGYYGSILGSLITVVALAVTISFTKKPIWRENYLDAENKKWDRIDTIFMEILDSINPINILKITMAVGDTDTSRAINSLSEFQMNCSISCDQLNANLNTDDYPKFKELVNRINSLATELSDISQMLIEQYSNLKLFKERDTALQIFANESKHPGSFPKETIDFSNAVLAKTKGMTPLSINNRITEINEMFIKTYATQYRALLQLKGSTFEVVRSDTRKSADNILNWRKN